MFVSVVVHTACLHGGKGHVPCHPKNKAVLTEAGGRLGLGRGQGPKLAAAQVKDAGAGCYKSSVPQASLFVHSVLCTAVL